MVSSIDKWFMGPVPQFSSRDIGVLGDKQELCALLERAKKIANDPTQMKWESVRIFLFEVFCWFDVSDVGRA